jgi:hypothetical protein
MRNEVVHPIFRLPLSRWGEIFRRRSVMNSRALEPSTLRVETGANLGGRRASRRTQLIACALAVTVATFGLADPSIGQSDANKSKTEPVKEAKAEVGLEGSWSGGGEVAFAATGSRERARCRAHYTRRSKDSYAMNATCATASGKAAQTATVHRVGENRYRGNFHNAEYDISGTIFVVVSGNSQSVRLTSTSGSAMFRLSR